MASASLALLLSLVLVLLMLLLLSFWSSLNCFAEPAVELPAVELVQTGDKEKWCDFSKLDVVTVEYTDSST